MIARRIATEYKAQWIKAFGEVEVKTEKGKRALVRDAESFEAKLGKVEEFGGVGKEVMGVVKAKVGFVDEKKAEKAAEVKAENDTEKGEKKKEEVAPAPVGKEKGENGEVDAGEKRNGEDVKA
jgi:vacuolar protein sorting-associated protein 54